MHLKPIPVFYCPLFYCAGRKCSPASGLPGTTCTQGNGSCLSKQSSFSRSVDWHATHLGNLSFGYLVKQALGHIGQAKSDFGVGPKANQNRLSPQVQPRDHGKQFACTHQSGWGCTILFRMSTCSTTRSFLARCHLTSTELVCHISPIQTPLVRL